MLTASTLRFLKDLKANNEREWFHANKDRYQTARADFYDLVQNLIGELAKFDEGIAGLAPKDCAFRINRDVRFSKDKSPYKPNFGAAITAGGRKSPKGGYYIHIEPGANFLAGGMYCPPSPILKAVRQEIDYNTEEFRTIIGDPNFVKQYQKLDNKDMLKTAPKGYPKDHPAIDLLRHKSFVVFKQVKDVDLKKEAFLPAAIETYSALKPLNDFLNRAID